jgi:hypothetical protein
MSQLEIYQYVLIALIFVWSGFVRSGLGFGGAVMSLPFLLLIDNQPLVFLPIIVFFINNRMAKLTQAEIIGDSEYLSGATSGNCGLALFEKSARYYDCAEINWGVWFINPAV